MPLERQVTQLLRESGAVLDEAARFDIVVHRQGSPDLMLVEVKREVGIRQSVLQFASLLAFLVNDRRIDPDVIAEDIATAIPWTQYLSGEDRLAFIRELATESRAGADLESYDRIPIVLASWRNTARLYAVPELREAATTAEDDRSAESVAQLT